MPGSAARYSLSDDALTALLALSERDRRIVYAAFEQLAQDPLGCERSIVRDWDGRYVFAIRYGRFEIGHAINPSDGRLLFTLLRPFRD